MVLPPFDSNSWVLITGASGGIGEVFAKRFAHEGWNIVLAARSEDKLSSLAHTLEDESGIKTLALAGDLSRPDEPERLFGETKRRGMAVEALINNAGLGAKGRFYEGSMDRYREMITVMVTALVELTRLFFPPMKERGRGFIVNVSSTASFQPLPYSAVYAASKSFVSSFTEALWLESEGSGVRILNLCPGLTKTEFGIKAGMRDFRADFFAENPGRVVETAFRALKKGSPTVISGRRNRLLLMCERLLPHRWLLEAVKFYQRWKYRKSLTSFQRPIDSPNVKS